MKANDSRFVGIRGLEQMLKRCIDLYLVFVFRVRVWVILVVSIFVFMIRVRLLPIIGRAFMSGVVIVLGVVVTSVLRLTLNVYACGGTLVVVIMCGRNLLVNLTS